MKLLLLALLPAVAVSQLVTGGIADTTVSPSYEPVVFAVQAAKDHLAKSQAAGFADTLDLVEITRARTQVVAGQKLYLSLHLTQDFFCNVTVWFRSWMTGNDRLAITDGPSCTQEKVSTRAGGISQPKALPHAGPIVDALNFAACHLNDRINAMYAHRLGDTSTVYYTEQRKTCTFTVQYQAWLVQKFSLIDVQC